MKHLSNSGGPYTDP